MAGGRTPTSEGQCGAKQKHSVTITRPLVRPIRGVGCCYPTRVLFSQLRTGATQPRSSQLYALGEHTSPVLPVESNSCLQLKASTLERLSGCGSAQPLRATRVPRPHSLLCGGNLCGMRLSQHRQNSVRCDSSGVSPSGVCTWQSTKSRSVAVGALCCSAAGSMLASVPGLKRISIRKRFSSWMCLSMRSYIKITI